MEAFEVSVDVDEVCCCWSSIVVVYMKYLQVLSHISSELKRFSITASTSRHPAKENDSQRPVFRLN